jgi:NhaP-type Na+/H+ or K+/H+ antiporter
VGEYGYIIVLAFVFVFGLGSRRLDALGLSPPLVFLVFGVICGPYVLDIVELPRELVNVLAELTLMLVLFADASRIDLEALRKEAGLPVRLLGIGLPLTMVLGGGVAMLCFPKLGFPEAALIGTTLAATDAALGQAVVSSKHVPTAIRQALNVESGLNDGIALPIVMMFAAVAVDTSTGAHTDGLHWLLFWIKQIGLGPIAGLGVAWLGGIAAQWAVARGWMGDAFERIAGLCLGLLAYVVADLIGGNGFIAAFVAGLVLGNTSRGFALAVHTFVETEGQLLMLSVFMIVGAVWAYPTVVEATPIMWVYALASLTVIRMVPVALSLIGSEAKRGTVLFLGWFGPRGLASVLFALVVFEREAIRGREQVFSVVMLTVVCSIVAHGVTARAGTRRYARYLAAIDEAEKPAELAPVTEHLTRLEHGRQPGSKTRYNLRP